jgi:hypothetical protein
MRVVREMPVEEEESEESVVIQMMMKSLFVDFQLWQLVLVDRVGFD